MTFQTCPTDIVEAPAENIWEQLTTPCLYENWVDARLREGPDRSIVAGDRLLLGAGPGHRMRGVFDVVRHEVLRITQLGPRRCRVTYN
ncbi:hypothetical protein [Vitiosangium sp. GDMCC 1.1324]|uniref:hypothetical protein n=1 Tax=Vitiosangium sp. (strain GDMCC 1.1324) TaxID=2138576 RepID=UPI0011B37DF7|nr:hypothetical protein [Vitiosangium sp. GDMCC 1.1324]